MLLGEVLPPVTSAVLAFFVSATTRFSWAGGREVLVSFGSAC